MKDIKNYIIGNDEFEELMDLDATINYIDFFPSPLIKPIEIDESADYIF